MYIKKVAKNKHHVCRRHTTRTLNQSSVTNLSNVSVFCTGFDHTVRYVQHLLKKSEANKKKMLWFKNVQATKRAYFCSCKNWKRGPRANHESIFFTVVGNLSEKDASKMDATKITSPWTGNARGGGGIQDTPLYKGCGLS